MRISGWVIWLYKMYTWNPMEAGLILFLCSRHNSEQNCLVSWFTGEVLVKIQVDIWNNIMVRPSFTSWSLSNNWEKCQHKPWNMKFPHFDTTFIGCCAIQPLMSSEVIKAGISGPIHTTNELEFSGSPQQTDKTSNSGLKYKTFAHYFIDYYGFVD